jgi:hypothetical protein
MPFSIPPLLILISLSSLIIGLFIFLKPALAIEIQKKFYAKINWHIEPISMQKEVRNTKIMGLFLIGVGLLNIFYAALSTK